MHDRSKLLLLALAMAATLAAPPSALASPQRVPLGVLVTNWDCAPCAPANQLLDAWYDTVGDDFALIRVHCWWPGADDPIYRDNIAQSEWLIWDTPNGPDSAPHLWVDNTVNGGVYPEPMVGFMVDRARVPALLGVESSWSVDGQELDVVLDIPEALPAADYRLFVVATEDSVAAQGTNGEPYHQQAFRRLYPDTVGHAVSGAAGMHSYSVPVAIDGRWRADQLRLVAYVQNRDTGEVMNAATLKLADAVTAVPGDAPAATLAVTAYPNPFNPTVSIRYTIEAGGPVTVRIHDLTGRVVTTLVQAAMSAGDHETVWQGRDREGRAVASGLYLVQVRRGAQAVSHKLVLAR